MKILVLGATGGTGRQLVALALEKGHAVTAFARNPNGLALQHERLRKVRGDVTQPESIAGAVAGQDAVVSVVGPRPGVAPGTLISDTVHHAIGAMRAHGVRRFAFESGLIAGQVRGMTFPRRIGVAIFRQLNRALYEDKVKAEAELRATDLDWVIVRPPGFGELVARGAYRLGEDLDGKLTKMSATDVAAAMLDAATESKWIRKALELSY
jgi:putative NADH-flavin reductase